MFNRKCQKKSSVTAKCLINEANFGAQGRQIPNSNSYYCDDKAVSHFKELDNAYS